MLLHLYAEQPGLCHRLSTQDLVNGILELGLGVVALSDRVYKLPSLPADSMLA